MKTGIIKAAMIVMALLLPASVSLAVEIKAGTAGETKEIGKAKPSGKSAKAKDAKKAKVKLVDINSASKAELKKLPGISDAEADKIIAGRPYLSKAYLVTHKVIPHGIYEQIKRQIIAVQKPESAAKSSAK